MKQYDEAEQYLFEAKVASEKISNKTKLFRAHYLFTILYRNTNEPWKALEHYDSYESLKSEVMGKTANNKIKELQTPIMTEAERKRN